jgi:hypothetical protein
VRVARAAAAAADRARDTAASARASRPSRDPHHCSVCRDQPRVAQNSRAVWPLARHAVTRSFQISAVGRDTARVSFGIDPRSSRVKPSRQERGPCSGYLADDIDPYDGATHLRLALDANLLQAHAELLARFASDRDADAAMGLSAPGRTGDDIPSP